MPETAQDALDKLVLQASSLYSLPSAALEVMRLTESKEVDVQQLKQAIERDPALAVKLLRVVNSSLFGLSGKVADLNQALALLGVEPLKMLVLGFSLPDNLFAKLAGDPLRRYWTVSLTRAVSARALARRFPRVSGDEAFLAGLLRDLGLLVMVQQLGEPYLRLIKLAGKASAQLSELEIESLGFNHTQLSAALLRNWNLPERLAAAVDLSPGAGKLREVVALADLMTQLVLDHRLDALPELLEQGEATCGLTKPILNAILEPLQAQVDQLAAAMAVELTDGLDYQQVLTDAHAQLAMTTEHAIGLFLQQKTDDEVAELLLAESHEVRLAMRSFLRGDRAVGQLTRAEGPHVPRNKIDEALPIAELSEGAHDRLLEFTHKLAAHCRVERTELSLLLIELTAPGRLEPAAVERGVRLALATAQEQCQTEPPTRLTLDDAHLAILLPGVDRHDAVAFAAAVAEAAGQNDALRLKLGVASISQVPNRFDSARLVAAALGCLNATLVAGATSVKSIEVY